jgi:nicotinate-nucleotide adenylyltransferase
LAGAATAPIGILGGTFDPIHFGHLRTALELLEILHLAEVKFIPCREPPHRPAPPHVGDLRLDMVRAAVASEDRFSVDDREFRRTGPSYTVDTLASLRGEFPSRPLCLLLGMDAFVGLPEWHRWTDLLDYAHLGVAHRPGWAMPEDGPLGDLLEQHRVDRPALLQESICGHVFVTPVTQLEIAATDLRRVLGRGLDPRYLVPDSVREIILRSACYRQIQDG